MSAIRRTLGAAVLAATLVGPATAASGDAREDREEIRREQAAVAAELDVLQAQDAEIAAALETLATNIVAEGAALEVARAEADRTAAELVAARSAEAALEAQLEVRRDQVETLAIRAYTGAGTDGAIAVALDADTPLEAEHRLTLADSGAAQLRDAVDALAAAEAAQAEARRQADEAAQAAEATRAEVEGRLVALELAQQQHATLAAEVTTRIATRRSDADALAATAAELSAEILADEVAIVAAGSSASLPAPPVRTVQGFTVHEELADALGQLLDAAAEDGITLLGWGYRDSASQWALRVAHCPDPVSSPSSACSPPTAPVGSSMHERGLAIDFTCDGASIGTHESPCYRWLAEHAAEYGLYNLPSEPWHWSVTGT